MNNELLAAFEGLQQSLTAIIPQLHQECEAFPGEAARYNAEAYPVLVGQFGDALKQLGQCMLVSAKAPE